MEEPKKNCNYCSYNAAWYYSYYSKLKIKFQKKDKVPYQIFTIDE